MLSIIKSTVILYTPVRERYSDAWKIILCLWTNECSRVILKFFITFTIKVQEIFLCIIFTNKDWFKIIFFWLNLNFLFLKQCIKLRVFKKKLLMYNLFSTKYVIITENKSWKNEHNWIFFNQICICLHIKSQRKLIDGYKAG